MSEAMETRPGEETAELPPAADAALYFIGAIRTPWRTRRDCPRRGDMAEGPVCRVEVAPRWRKALKGLEGRSHAQILYWMHEARRDLVVQTPNHTGKSAGTFSLRSPNRPNPIASSLVAIVEVLPDALLVRGLDCLDGTPLVDVKPETCPFDQARPPQADP
jgi:tRNA-Thr(GGU) m(6)t(6)A37 methyltransferase TsaA